MKDLKGTKTEKNLQEAFAGESMARNKYTFFASKARKDGFELIAAIFEETAHNEKEHAELWYIFYSLSGRTPACWSSLRALIKLFLTRGSKEALTRSMSDFKQQQETRLDLLISSSYSFFGVGR